MLMTLSALFFALGDIIIKFMSPTFGLIQIAFVRFVFGALMLLPFLLSSGQPLKGNATRLLFLRGLTGTLAFFCLIKTIAMVPLSHAMVLFYTFPFFATVFSFVLLKEVLTKSEISLIVAGMIGIYTLINPGSHALTLGHVFGLLAASFAGLVMVLTRKLRKTNGPLIIYFYFCLVGAIVSFPFFVVNFAMPDIPRFSLLLLLAALLLFAQVFMNQGFKYCRASEGAVILMSEVVFTGIAGVLLFHDSLSLSFWVGACLIVGSGVVLNIMARPYRPLKKPV
jgi:drug/metabolite transporter (DMT)-like permease